MSEGTSDVPDKDRGPAVGTPGGEREVQVKGLDGNPEREASAAARSAALLVFRAAVDLVGRLGLVTLLGAISTIAITRLLGPTAFGSYASALATFAVLGALADFGFSFMLSRDAVAAPDMHRPMMRAAYEVATVWAAVLALVLAGLALSAGLSTDRGVVLLVLAPSMVFNGLNPARIFLVIANRTRLLLLIDVLTTSVQVAASIAVAAAGLGPIAVAVVVSVGTTFNAIAVALAAQRVIGPGARERFSRRVLVRRSVPLGLISIMTRIYLMIDLVLLGWLVSGPRLGQYAAAAKAVTVLAGVSGTVMTGALPTLAARVGDREQLEALVPRVWHWLVVGPLPVFVAVGVFATPLVHVALGLKYGQAAPLIRILAVAGCVGVLSNLTGNLMVAFRKNRALLVQNAIAIVVNITGNLILIPRIGVAAAAWMTVATEVLVCLGSIISIRNELNLSGIIIVSARPAIAVAVASGLALVLLESPLVAAFAAAVAFVGLLTVMSAWPAEFRLRLRPSVN